MRSDSRSKRNDVDSTDEPRARSREMSFSRRVSNSEAMRAMTTAATDTTPEMMMDICASAARARGGYCASASSRPVMTVTLTPAVSPTRSRGFALRSLSSLEIARARPSVILSGSTEMRTCARERGPQRLRSCPSKLVSRDHDRAAAQLVPAPPVATRGSENSGNFCPDVCGGVFGRDDSADLEDEALASGRGDLHVVADREFERVGDLLADGDLRGRYRPRQRRSCPPGWAGFQRQRRHPRVSLQPARSSQTGSSRQRVDPWRVRPPSAACVATASAVADHPSGAAFESTHDVKTPDDHGGVCASADY